MKRILTVSAVLLACNSYGSAQIGRTFDWHTAGGDSQRTGWEKSDTKFTKDGVKDFKFLYKHQFEGASKKGQGSLTAPVVLGTLVSYRGFKELAFVASGAGDVWALDVDLDKVFWERHLDLPKVKGKEKAGCSTGITSQATMEPGVTFGAPAGRRRRTTGGGAGSQMDMFRRIFAPRTLYVAANDGNLYRLDTSTGKDMKPPVALFPAGGNATNLNAAEATLYATTANSCGGAPNALWKADVSSDPPKVTSYKSPAPEGFVGRAGVVLDPDGDVYVQTSNTLQILAGKDLNVQQTFSAALGNTSPLVFSNKDKDYIVTAGKFGGLYLLDSKSFSTPLYQTPAIAADLDHGLSAGLSTWETPEGTRYILVPVSGALSEDLKVPQKNGDAADGSLVAFKLAEEEGKPVLTPVWVSRNLVAPQAAVIANGVVFAVSAGSYGKKGKLEGHATLHGLDGETGKEIYSSGDQATAPASLSGVTMANGRIFFTTTDNSLYAFGYDLEH